MLIKGLLFNFLNKKALQKVTGVSGFPLGVTDLNHVPMYNSDTKLFLLFTGQSGPLTSYKTCFL